MVERLGQRRLQIRRVGIQTQQRGKFLRSQTKKAIETKQRQTLAIDYDTFFTTSEFGTIQEIESEFAKIDPNVKQFMTYSVSIAKQDLNNRIKQIESDIITSREKERKYKKDKNKVNRKGERARQSGLSQGLDRLRKGELLTTLAINNYAGDLLKMVEIS